MKKLALGPLALFMVVIWSSACGDDSSEEKTSREEETDPEEESTSSDGETDTGDPSETDETDGTDDTDGTESPEDPQDLNDAPTDLPAICRLHTEKVAGEDVGRFPVSIGGDARYPDIAADSDGRTAVMVWGYIGNDIPTWRLQSTRYDLELADDDILRELGEIQEVTLAETSPLSEQPSIALSDDGYVVVYQDSRYDDTCDTTQSGGYDACLRSVSLLSMDTDGSPTQDEPLRLSEGISKGRPSIARMPDGGYIVAWNEFVEDTVRTNVVRLSEALEPGDVVVLDEIPDESNGPVVACNDKVAVIVFATERQDGIVGVIWPHEETEPNDDQVVIASGNDDMSRPSIAAGEDGFMVSYNKEIASKAEVFLQPLDDMGEQDGSPNRATWAFEAVKSSEISWNGEMYAMVWESSTENGVSAWPRTDVKKETLCAYETCSEQIFATLVKTDGTVASEPVMLSHDINRCERSRIVWDGVGWTVVWQGWRELRWQVFHGQMLCD